MRATGLLQSKSPAFYRRQTRLLYDLLIRGATVVDGLGHDPRRADVAIAGDQIAAIGDIGRDAASKVIDAGGLALMPGIIGTPVFNGENYTRLDKGPGRVLDRFLPATAAPVAAAAK